MNENAWRAILAALADDTARALYAKIVLGEPVDVIVASAPPARIRRATAALTAAGLIVDTPDGYTAPSAVFSDALSAAPRGVRPRGVDRFFTDGRLTGYPARAADRREVLAAVASRVLSDGEVLTERGMNDRLATIVDDVAAIRRYLVDARLVERTRSGTAYALAHA